MRIAVLLLGIGMLVPASGYAQFDDEKREKDTDAAGERAAWSGWLKKLGTGPVYRVEVLFRGARDGRLYLAETLLSSKVPHSRMMGFGLNGNGEPFPPPDPGYQPTREALVDVADKTDNASHPLAWKFHDYGASLRDGGSARHSDLDTNLNLPREAGKVRYTLHNGAFRVERLSVEQLTKAQPLRRDPKYFRNRTAAILTELLTSYRKDWSKSEHGVVQIARLFPEPDLIADVRKLLTDWIDRAPAEVVGKGWPHALVHAIADVGTAKDFALLHRLARRHPKYASFTITHAIRLVQRVGGRDAGPLVADLLALTERFSTGSECAKWLRRVATQVPEPTYGDYTVMTIAGTFGRKPTDFGMMFAREIVLDQLGQAPLASREKELAREAAAHPEDWVFPTAAARKAGIAAALKWVTEYQPSKRKIVD